MKDKYYQKNFDFNGVFEDFQLGKTKDEDIKNRRLITSWLWKQYSKLKTKETTKQLELLEEIKKEANDAIIGDEEPVMAFIKPIRVIDSKILSIKEELK